MYPLAGLPVGPVLPACHTSSTWSTVEAHQAIQVLFFFLAPVLSCKMCALSSSSKLTCCCTWAVCAVAPFEQEDRQRHQLAAYYTGARPCVRQRLACDMHDFVGNPHSWMLVCRAHALMYVWPTFCSCSAALGLLPTVHSVSSTLKALSYDWLR